MVKDGNAQIHPARRGLLSLAAALFLILSVPISVLAALLLAHGETVQGRLFAVAVMTGLPAPVLLWVASYLRRKRRLLSAAVILVGLSLLLLGIDYVLTPDGLPWPGSPARSCFAGTASYQRASPANLVPEMDQLILATYVIPSLDPLMDEPNTTELRGQVRGIYREMRRAPEFECLGSVLNQAYGELFLGVRPVGHFYEYTPAAPP